MGVMKRLSEQMRTPKRRNSLIGAREGLPFEISLESTSRIARYERRQDKEKLRQFNSEVKEWMGYVIQDLKGNIALLVQKDEFLSDSLNPEFTKVKERPNEWDSVSPVKVSISIREPDGAKVVSGAALNGRTNTGS